MGLKLIRVELVNIRSHEHIVFTPEAQGITAIQGANGVGKSSIVDSIAWCLYGTKPNGVSKANEIFRSGIGDKDKAFAVVYLEVDGKLMRFERRRVNKHGGIEVEVFTVEKDDQGDEKLTNVAGPAITHAESYIRKLLRMDEKGFLAAVLIQQKQVDQLISTGPRERGQVIEKLTGIAGITAALTEAKQEYNSLKKAASFSSIDSQALGKLQLEEQKLTEQALDLKSNLGNVKDQVIELKKIGEGIKGQLETATALFDRKTTLENDLNAYVVKEALKREALDATLADKEEAKRALTVGGGQSVETLNELIREKDAQRADHSLAKSKAEDSKAEIQAKIVENQAILEAYSEVDGDEDEITALLAEQKDQIDDLKGNLIEARSERQKLEQAIGIIEHGDSCPTCLQTVSDVSVAVKSLYETISKIDENSERTKTALENIQQEHAAQRELLEKISVKQKAQLFLATTEESIKETNKILDSSGAQLRLVEKELNALRKNLDEARQEQQKRQAHQRLLEKAQALTSELETIDFNIARIKKESSELGPSSQREISSLQKKLDDIRSKHSSLSLEYTTKNGELKLLAQKIEHLRTDIKRHEEDIKRHNELIQSVAVAAHTHEVIGEFREERIKNSIPVIEVYASDLLNRFTEGKFTRLSLNQKFEATVYLANGTSRAVGLLSGGELSAAAMALRLAISLLLNSGADQNLMILDEVLVSQDGNRAEQILSTLKEVARGQVILIAHNESIDAVADKIVTLNGKEKGDEGLED